MSKAEKGVAAVVGVGDGLGLRSLSPFATDYKVALIARSAGVIEKTASEIRKGGRHRIAHPERCYHREGNRRGACANQA